MAGDLAALDELVEDILDRRGVTPTKLGSDFCESGHRVISAKLMKDHRLDLSADEARYVDAPTYRRWMATPILADDVLLTSEAPLGEVAYVERNVDWCLGQRLFCIRTDKRKLHGRYLFYCLRGEPSRADLLARATGTTVQGIRQSELRRVGIPVRPLPEQKRIARILGTLDDKIELNRRMNATLEGISLAIFKSWFVDFDPVRQKAAGRQPVGMDAQTAALFPDSFEDSEIGEVPKGWRCGRLDDAIVLQRGFDLPASARTDGKHPVMVAGGLNGFHNEYMVRGPGVTTGRSGVLGKVYFVHDDFWPLNTSLWVKEYRASSPLHAYHMLTRIDFNVFNAGSAVPTLNRNHVHSLPAIIAGPDVVHAFDAVIGPMFTANRLREAESRTLAALRDTLLPKLLSGEIRVPEAKEAVEEVLA